MTTEEIVEGNKLIAEFMGAMRQDLGYLLASDTINWVTTRGLKYHSSWDWLMTVVEKIEEDSIWAKVTIADIICYISESKFISFSGKTKIDTVYYCVIQFIKWHNEQRGTNTTSDKE